MRGRKIAASYNKADIMKAISRIVMRRDCLEDKFRLTP